MRVWRICSQKYAADAFNGEGAYREGGRWNPPGYHVVYTSVSLSLAALEHFVNLELDDLPLPMAALSADIPESVKTASLTIEDLPEIGRAHV